MYRLFETHRIRKEIKLPEFWTLDVKGHSNIKIPVPSCIETVPQLCSYKGVCRISAAQRMSGNIRLVFKGVGHTARVLFDGGEVCSHYGAYGEFSAVIKNCADAVHNITVVADNRYTEESALHIDNDYYSYLGITRPAFAQVLEGAYVRYAHATPVIRDGVWHLDIEAEAENITEVDTEGKISFYVSATDEDICEKNALFTAECGISIPANGRQRVKTTVACPDVKAYTPATPTMYCLHTHITVDGVAIDDLIDRFGFREVKVCGTQILFGGEAMRIKGFNRHEDYAEFGSSVPLSAMVRDIMLIKNAGANCIRTCHYPNDERFLDLCDEHGIYVWEEGHARGLKEEHMRNPHFMEQSRLTVSEMIEQHYNHPSIFVWGLLNECASDTEYGSACHRELIALIRSLDPSRPVTFASNKGDKDMCYGDVDIVSANIYPAWYKDAVCSEFVDERVNTIRSLGGENKPIIISEIGAGGIYGYRTSIRCKWSEEGQSDILEEQVSAVLDHPACSGVIIWQFADCRVDDGWALKRPKTQNNKGVVDIYRREKLAYATVKEIFENHK